MGNKSIEFVMRCLERQRKQNFGRDFLPAIRSVLGEAPSASRCSRIFSTKLGRELHLLSRPERYAALFAIFHPNVIDVLEQRVIWPEATQHPLQDHRMRGGQRLPVLPGTIEIANELGVSDTVRWARFERGEDAMQVPIPWVGDLLLVLKDGAGIYAVNWTIKSSEEDFERPFQRRAISRSSRKGIERAKARHQVEALCFARAGIRTERIVERSFDAAMIANLNALLPWTSRTNACSDEANIALCDALASLVGTDESPLDALPRLERAFSCTIYDIQVALFNGIWHRQIRVNLFRPILFSKPLRPEEADPLSRYARFFERGVA